jgi:GT2 family glycosyltransferase
MTFGHLGACEQSMNSTYHTWLDRYDVLRSDDSDAIRSDAATVNLVAPAIVIRFNRNTESNLSQALQGLQNQALTDWRALVYLDETCSQETRELANTLTAGDTRISLATKYSEGAALLAGRPTTVLFACGSVILREHAVYMFARAARDQTIALVYSDEDHLGRNGERTSPIFKPAFSPELLKQNCYLGNCILLKAGPTDLASAVTDFTEPHYDFSSFIDAQIHRVGPTNVLHVPHVLFHYTASPSLRNVDSAVDLHNDSLPSVSIIIPTKDHLELISACLESIKARTNYPKDRYEIVVVDNCSEDPAVLAYLAEAHESGSIRLLRNAAAFNFSRINNKAAECCTSEMLLFLNNDVEIIDPGWIRRLVGYATQPDVGVVGCKLLYPDGTVQHAGMVLGIRGSAVHAHLGIHRDDPGFQGLACLTREVSAVTGACMAIRRELFLRLGGFDEELKVAFNDTDLCLRSLTHGLRNIFVGVPLAIHHEGMTRGRDDTSQKAAMFRFEAAVARRRHAKFYKDDPYYNPNLSVDRVHQLAFPPRRTLPWKIPKPPAPLSILWVAPPGTRPPDLNAVRTQLQRLRDAGHPVSVVSAVDLSRELPEFPSVVVSSPEQIADFAVLNDFDCIVLGDPCFLAVAPLIGDWPLVICCDHTELAEELFPDVRAHLEEQREVALSMADAMIDRPPLANPSADPNGNSEWSNEFLGIIRSLQVARASGVPFQRRHIMHALISPADGACQNHPTGECQSREPFYAKLRDLEGPALIDQLYLSVLGRYSDAAGREAYLRQIEQGVPKDAIIRDIVTSDEGKSRGVIPEGVMRLAGIQERPSRAQGGTVGPKGAPVHGLDLPMSAILAADDTEFIARAYSEILGRPPDAQGLSFYQSRLNAGVSKRAIIIQICNSSEAKQRGVKKSRHTEGKVRNWIGKIISRVRKDDPV